MLEFGNRPLVNCAYQLIRTLLFPARPETVESTSRTVEDGGRERFCGLDVNQSLPQPTNIPLTVHKAPERTKLQAASYVGVGYTWPLELAHKTELRRNFLLKLKACAGQRVTLFERLDWKTPCLMHTLANPLRSSHKHTWAFYACVDGLSLGTIKNRRYSFLKSAWRDHSQCSVQIVTKST